MRLYLSSYRFGNRASELRAMASGNVAVVIPNALDYSNDLARRAAGIEREVRQLTELGFSVRELDLRVYFGQPGALIEQLSNVALIWAVGGNAFLLRRALKQSGLDVYLSTRKGDPSLIYGGYSAGAIVVTPTLEGIELVDSPTAIADGYDTEVVWDGVGLVPYSLAPHYKSPHPESEAIDAVVNYFIANNLPFEALRDGDVIITDA